MNRRHWQDWLNFIFGIWIFVSPWVISYAMASPTNPAGVTNLALWNLYIVGIVVALVAIIAVFAYTAWEEWVNVVLGIWLLISPWVFEFSAAISLMWNAVIVGVVIFCLAGWTLIEEQGAKRAAS